MQMQIFSSKKLPQHAHRPWINAAALRRVQVNRSCFTFSWLSFVFPVWPKQKESDQQITVQVEGGLTTFTQKGLAAGQEYAVSISGEIGGRRGAESSAEFMTRELSMFICALLNTADT